MGTDLDAAIRAKLNGEGLDGFESRPCLSVEGCDVVGFDEMRNALLAVLELHGSYETDPCRGFADGAYWGPNGFKPCSTRKAIAKALGVEG